jgi:hypothetical protein
MFGPTDQKLSGNENFRRNVDMASKCWSQRARVDYMCPKMWTGRRKGILARRSLGHPHRARRRPVVARRA